MLQRDTFNLWVKSHICKNSNEHVINQVEQKAVDFDFLQSLFRRMDINGIGFSAGIEMHFQYRYQTLTWLCISIYIEISFHTVKCNILHLLILELSKICLLTYKINK